MQIHILINTSKSQNKFVSPTKYYNECYIEYFIYFCVLCTFYAIYEFSIDA